MHREGDNALHCLELRYKFEVSGSVCSWHPTHASKALRVVCKGMNRVWAASPVAFWVRLLLTAGYTVGLKSLPCRTASNRRKPINPLTPFHFMEPKCLPGAIQCVVNNYQNEDEALLNKTHHQSPPTDNISLSAAHFFKPHKKPLENL